MKIFAKSSAVLFSLSFYSTTFASSVLEERYTFKVIDGEGLNVFQAEKELPIVRLLDKDDDGKVDYMITIITDSSDDSVRDVFDYNFDGIPDARMEFEEGKFYVMYKGEWNRVFYDKNKINWYVVVDDVKVLLNEENSLFMKYHHKTHNKALNSQPSAAGTPQIGAP